MAKCQRCESERVLSINAKCSDMCVAEIGGHEQDGYVPQDVLIGAGGWGDYVQFAVCLDCGQMQGTFPQGRMALEDGGDGDE